MKKEPIYIVGPCAAESEEQVLSTAQAIRQAMPDTRLIYRAGLWKPRTSPDTFQGVGETGLKWLQAVTEQTGMPCATEVATPEQVRAAWDAQIPYLWIGARTSANPIAVQEIAAQISQMSAEHQTCQAVLIKNPVNADAALWLGNIQRLENTGAEVIAVHRGCNHQPCWEMARQIRQARPDIRILLDPSHMSGQAAAVPSLCRKAQELSYDGLMVESHIAPEKALSDSKQQITPADFKWIIERLEQTGKRQDANDLVWLRAIMDETDDKLWQVIAERMHISRQIGTWKKANGMDIIQPERYQDILQQRLKWAEKNGIDKQTVTAIMDALHTESIKQQA